VTCPALASVKKIADHLATRKGGLDPAVAGGKHTRCVGPRRDQGLIQQIACDPQRHLLSLPPVVPTFTPYALGAELLGSAANGPLNHE